MKLRTIGALSALALATGLGLSACSQGDGDKMMEEETVSSMVMGTDERGDDKMSDDKMMEDESKMSDEKMSDDKMGDDEMSDESKMSDEKK